MGLYSFLINAFEVLCGWRVNGVCDLLLRRDILKLKRFISKDLDGWPRSDANYILTTDIANVVVPMMNACDTLLQQRGYGHYGGHVTGDFIFRH